jgi:hypothetical protein
MVVLHTKPKIISKTLAAKAVLPQKQSILHQNSHLMTKSSLFYPQFMITQNAELQIFI